MEIKKKLNSLKYNEEQDINIFIATLQNLIDELENIDHDMEPSIKAGILNRALPENYDSSTYTNTNTIGTNSANT